MRGRWSMGVAVAILVAIAVASALKPAPEVRADPPLLVTLALQSDGVALRVARGNVTVTFEF